MIADVVIAVLLLLPALVLITMMFYSVLPWASKSWREAEERADLLVRSVLSDEEYSSIQRNGYLDIPSPNYPTRVYRVPSGTGTVAMMEDGRCVARLCLYSTVSIPDRENVVVHKLMIEGNEQDYLKTANHLPC